MIESLSKSPSSSKYSINKAIYFSWVKVIDEGEGKNSQFQIEALLACWLSYFFFPSLPEDGLHSYVFLLPVLLAKGN